MTTEIKQGTEVIVIDPRGMYSKQPPREIAAMVQKAGRVWLEIVSLDGSGKFWRMRRDTQQELVTGKTPGGGMYQARFRTAEQLAARKGFQQARATADQMGKQIDALLSAARDEKNAERATAAQEALSAAAEYLQTQALWVTDGIA